ncbi:hypothetical protein KCU81_g285, partial [Aureobasidium melanogenum]
MLQVATTVPAIVVLGIIGAPDSVTKPSPPFWQQVPAEVFRFFELDKLSVPSRLLPFVTEQIAASSPDNCTRRCFGRRNRHFDFGASAGPSHTAAFSFLHGFSAWVGVTRRRSCNLHGCAAPKKK